MLQRNGFQAPIVSNDGSPTTDPNSFYGPPRGSLLPFGEVGYKGYALGLLAELLGGVLTGSAVASANRQVNGVFFWLVDPQGFLPKGRTEELAQLVVDYMHSTPPAPGFDRVLVPGELEAQRAATRTMVQVSEAVWDQLCAAGHELGINVEAAEVPAEVANSRPT